MKIYKAKDVVTFTIGSEIFKGNIIDSHVSIRGAPNHTIFDKLGIKDKATFCSEHYGYASSTRGWPECKSGDYEALSRLIHALQELCVKHNGKTTQKFSIGDKVKIISNHPDPHHFEIGEVVTIKNYSSKGDRYQCTNQKESWMVNIDCVAQVDTTITQEPNVGDWVKCISHSDWWSERFVIGNTYKIQAISQNSYSVADSRNILLWVPKQDFILYESECIEPIQDDSEWKVGDTLQYIREGNYEWALNNCTVGDCYTIIAKHPKLGYPVIIDDVEDAVSLTPEELKCFKIINNQTTINYVKDNSFELPSSSPAISARQTPRGGIVSSSDLEVWI